MSELQLDNQLWQFSLQQYGKPEVAQICLTLQNEHEANINLILYCLWLAQIEKCFDWADILHNENREEWRRDHILPLRESRLALKQAGLRDAEQITEYERLKQKELLAEQKEQAMLFMMSLDIPVVAKCKCRDTTKLASTNLYTYSDRGVVNGRAAKPLFEKLLQLVA